MTKCNKTNKERAIVCIDGFNLYYGIKELKKPMYKWLDVQKLAESFTAKIHAEVIQIKYFTSCIAGGCPRGSDTRQKIYLSALATLPKVNIYYGKFLSKPRICKHCRECYTIFEEKQTDVNLACELLSDAYENRFDRVYIVSGDSDLITAVEKASKLDKKIYMAFPPNRTSSILSKKVTKFHIKAQRLKACLLPQQISTKRGKVLYCPEAWQ